jgi:hypothetical protein
MTLNWIVSSAANTPDMLVDELAGSELNALKRRRQYIVAINCCALIVALFAPIVAIAMYIAVAILFFLIAPISIARKRYS